MKEILYTISVSCPWCGRGETLADKNADINVSCRCHQCGNPYQVNFQTMRVTKGKLKKKPPPKRTA